MMERMKQVFINFIILTLTWGGMFRQSFNCDTLTHLVHYDISFNARICCGRYLAALRDFILYQFGITTADHTGISVICCLMLFAVVIMFVQNIFKNYILTSTYNCFELVFYYAATILICVNVLFSEKLMFAECSIMFAVGYVWAIGGIYYFIHKKYVRAFLFFLCATMEYQMGVIFAVIILTAWIFVNEKCQLTANAVKEQILCSVLTLGAGFINLISIEVLTRFGIIDVIYKDTGASDWRLKVRACLQDFCSIIKDSKELLPDIWLPLIILLIAVGIIFTKIIKEKNVGTMLYMVLLLIAMIVYLYIIPIVQQTVSTPPRMLFLFYTVQSMLLIIAYLFASEMAKKILCFVIGGYLMVQMLFCNIIVTNHFISNTLDKTYATIAYEKIINYEADSGNKVTTLVVGKDANCPFSYDNVQYKTYQINERALGQVTHTLMEYVSGRRFEKEEMTEEIYHKYFTKDNWDYFQPEEQLVFDGDTAYWVIF